MSTIIRGYERRGSGAWRFGSEHKLIGQARAGCHPYRMSSVQDERFLRVGLPGVRAYNSKGTSRAQRAPDGGYVVLFGRVEIVYENRLNHRSSRFGN